MECRQRQYEPGIGSGSRPRRVAVFARHRVRDHCSGCAARLAYVSFDGGNSWRDITGTLPDRYLVDVAIHPTDARTVYITASGFGSDHVWKSTDAGAHWKSVGIGLPDLPTSAVAIDPDNPNTVYLGNDAGVYVTRDGGVHWSAWSEGLPSPVIAMDLSVSPSNRALRVATHGNGVYERSLIPTVLTDAEAAGRPDAFGIESIFPQPACGTVNAELRLPTTGTVRVSIVTASGQRLAERWLQATTPRAALNLALHGIASGVYFLVAEQQGRVYAKPFLIAR